MKLTVNKAHVPLVHPAPSWNAWTRTVPPALSIVVVRLPPCIQPAANDAPVAVTTDGLKAIAMSKPLSVSPEARLTVTGTEVAPPAAALPLPTVMDVPGDAPEGAILNSSAPTAKSVPTNNGFRRLSILMSGNWSFLSSGAYVVHQSVGPASPKFAAVRETSTMSTSPDASRSAANVPGTSPNRPATRETSTMVTEPSASTSPARSVARGNDVLPDVVRSPVRRALRKPGEEAVTVYVVLAARPPTLNDPSAPVVAVTPPG